MGRHPAPGQVMTMDPIEELLLFAQEVVRDRQEPDDPHTVDCWRRHAPCFAMLVIETLSAMGEHDATVLRDAAERFDTTFGMPYQEVRLSTGPGRWMRAEAQRLEAA